MNAGASIDRLVELTQQRDYAGVTALWERLPAAIQQLEIAARIAATAFAQSGRLPQAEAVLAALLAAQANVEPATLALAGRIAFDLGDVDASLSRLERAVTLRGEPLWWLWLADAAIRAQRPRRALALAQPFERLRDQSPELAIMHATLLAHAGDADDARAGFERVLALWPRHEVAGPGYAEFVMREFPIEAEGLLASTAWQPTWNGLSAAHVRAALWLPAFYESEAAAARWRARLLTELQHLTEAALRSPLRGDERASCIATTPFFVAFHDADVTAIQNAWGEFVEAVVAPLRAEIGVPAPGLRPRDGPVRSIGIVSNRITSSSAGRFFNGWIDELAAAGFSVRLYALGNTDATTAQFASSYPLRHFAMDDSAHWRVAAEALRDDGNDALLFPEPQGSQLTMLLAGLGLAPLQCAAFGNPLTTGLKTIDYFLSPDSAEVADPGAHYRERVIRLAGMGTSVTADLPASIGRIEKSELGLAERQRVYLVSQQLQKWSPDFVDLLARVLTEDRSGQLVYFNIGGTVSVRAFEHYLQGRLREHGIDAAQRTTGLPVADRARFLAINRGADVAIDTLGFGGGSTTFDALSVGLPVVTRRGNYLRSRQTAGMLALSGQGELIANSVEDMQRLALEVAAVSRRPDNDAAGTVSLSGSRMAATPGCFATAAAFFNSLR